MAWGRIGYAKHFVLQCAFLHMVLLYRYTSRSSAHERFFRRGFSLLFASSFFVYFSFSLFFFFLVSSHCFAFKRGSIRCSIRFSRLSSYQRVHNVPFVHFALLALRTRLAMQIDSFVYSPRENQQCSHTVASEGSLNFFPSSTQLTLIRNFHNFLPLKISLNYHFYQLFYLKENKPRNYCSSQKSLAINLVCK